MREMDEPTSAVRGAAASSRYVQFGPFQIDQQRQEISRDGESLKLQGKVYQVLQALLEKPGEVVTREELRQKLWPAETHVNYDANVNTTVNKLRLALGDSSDRPLYIETIPRKGYCLIVQPEYSDAPRKYVRSDKPPAPGQPLARISDSSGELKSDRWVVIAVIGLILAGMLLGAGITRLWISHLAPVSLWP